MAFRWSRRTGGWLLVVILVGAGCAQGSGSHALTDQAPALEVLGAVEERASTAPDPTLVETSSTTVAPAPAPTAAPTSTEPPTTTGAPATTTPPTSVAVVEPERSAAEPDPEPEVAPAEADIGSQTLARISYAWRDKLPGWRIEFLPARAGLRGLTFPATRRIEIYVRASDTPASLARVVAHELGHAVDVARNDAAERARWRAARGAADTVPWWPEPQVSDFATLAGDFAEAFAVWQTGTTSQSTAAGPLTEDQLALVASLAG